MQKFDSIDEVIGNQIGQYDEVVGPYQPGEVPAALQEISVNYWDEAFEIDVNGEIYIGIRSNNRA